MKSVSWNLPSYFVIIYELKDFFKKSGEIQIFYHDGFKLMKSWRGYWFFFLGVRGIAWYMLIYQGVKIIQLCNEENIFGIFLICNTGVEKVRIQKCVENGKLFLHLWKWFKIFEILFVFKLIQQCQTLKGFPKKNISCVNFVLRALFSVQCRLFNEIKEEISCKLKK